MCLFFFKQKTAYEMRISDWSSDVCSSDLNTHALLQSLRIERAVVVGHSMGGMLAARYALQYPLATGHLVLVNPIGLEDWRAEGVPWRSVDAWYAGQLKTEIGRAHV